MIAARMLFCALVATAALAQSDIFERLRRALPAAEAETASEALRARRFHDVEVLLGRTPNNTTESERSEWLALQGAVEFLDGQMGPAAAAFRGAAKLAPLTEGDSFTLAMAWVKLGDHEQARAVLNKLLANNPQHAIYLYWLGRLDYDQHRYQEAVEKLTRTTQLDPRSARAWDSLGLAFDMQGRMEEAVAAFQKAAALNREQGSVSAWPPHDLGYLLLRMERLAEAEAALRESLRYDSSLAQTHLYIGRVLEKEGRTDQAMDEYIQANSLDRASPDSCYSLATLYRRLHRDREAEQMFAEFRKRRLASDLATASPNEHLR